MPTPKFSLSHVLVDCENVGLNGLTDLVVNTDGSPLRNSGYDPLVLRV